MTKKASKVQGIHLHKTNRYYQRAQKPKVEFYWILNARNGRTLARSSEMYTTKQACIKSIIATANWFGDNGHYYDHTGKEINLVVL